MTPTSPEAMDRQALSDLGKTWEGRHFLARLFRESRCLESVFNKSADVYRLAGVQAFGLRYLRELHAANPEASHAIYDELMRPPEKENEDGSAQ